QRRNRPGNDYLEALDDILEESERTSQVIDSLMLLARADAGKEVVERAPADASSISRAAVEQGEKLARIRGLDFSASVPEEPIWVHADAEALRRALLILIDNAAKYTPEGGSVRIDLTANDGLAIFSVSDTGLGMATIDLPHIFYRFLISD